MLFLVLLRFFFQTNLFCFFSLFLPVNTQKYTYFEISFTICYHMSKDQERQILSARIFKFGVILTLESLKFRFFGLLCLPNSTEFHKTSWSSEILEFRGCFSGETCSAMLFSSMSSITLLRIVCFIMFTGWKSHAITDVHKAIKMKLSSKICISNTLNTSNHYMVVSLCLYIRKIILK